MHTSTIAPKPHSTSMPSPASMRAMHVLLGAPSEGSVGRVANGIVTTTDGDGGGVGASASLSHQ